MPGPTAEEPGPAWAAGLEAARGEYAWFVGPTGDLADGALATVAARLHELRPDLLLIGHHGRTGPAVRLPAADGLFTVAERPDAFDSAPEVWARVVHRDLVARAGFPFHRGRYAEVTFSYPLLVAAERIAVHNRVCYHGADPAPIPAETEFEVFDQYERLFALLDRWGVDGRDARDRGEVRPRIADRMMAHYWWLFAESGRVPATLQRGFFARMSEHQQRYLAPAPRTRAGLDDRLVGRDRWKTYVAVRSV